ncbi:hypothetical protein ACHQM5_005600 [Ranunculus cassubicifolius]
MVGFGIHAREQKRKIQEIKDWLKILIKIKYFEPCFNHQSLKKNESNRFCINCRESLCQRCCENSHSLHKILQIRKYVYEDVVRIKDMNQYFDCAKIQHYVNNGSRVVYLNSRVGFKSLKPTGCGPFCEHCKRSVAEPHRYCSIACKLAVSKENGKEGNDNHIFPNQNQELCGLYQDTESDTKDDSSDSLHAEAEWSNGSLFHSAEKSRLIKRKGFACRAPFF